MKRRGWRPVPPLYFFVAILLMAGLHAWVPLAQTVPGPYNLLGIVLMVAGIAFSLWGALLFRSHGTTVRPFAESASLVMEGPYRITRNPMYLGLTIALTGVALLLGTFSPWLVLPAFVWLIQAFVIKVEEEMLAEKFGSEYIAYRSRVRRWI